MLSDAFESHRMPESPFRTVRHALNLRIRFIWGGTDVDQNIHRYPCNACRVRRTRTDYAGELETTDCVGSNGVVSCVTVWRQGGDPQIIRTPSADGALERSEIAERDRKWLARCRPVITQDRYGVGRYQYAASGCEFGVIGTKIVE